MLSCLCLTNTGERRRVARALRTERCTLAYCRTNEAQLATLTLAPATRGLRLRVYASMRAELRARLAGMRLILALLYT